MKKKPEYTVLNDFNDIVNYLKEDKKRREKENLIVISILGVALGLAVVLLYLFIKG